MWISWRSIDVVGKVLAAAGKPIIDAKKRGNRAAMWAVVNQLGEATIVGGVAHFLGMEPLTRYATIMGGCLIAANGLYERARAVKKMCQGDRHALGKLLLEEAGQLAVITGLRAYSMPQSFYLGTALFAMGMTLIVGKTQGVESPDSA